MKRFVLLTLCLSFLAAPNFASADKKKDEAKKALDKQARAKSDATRGIVRKRYVPKIKLQQKLLRITQNQAKRLNQRIRQLNAMIRKAMLQRKQAVSQLTKLKKKGTRQTVTLAMTVKQCKQAMRKTFGPGTSRAERKKWLNRCHSTYGLIKHEKSVGR
ncbi:MAG: hypothetical protein EP343_02430 [Deltaproteobacteria bacterium]|nr:MAG: hypothetical protein EP343_02430 [Deltaproteobacteria bacterium]